MSQLLRQSLSLARLVLGSAPSAGPLAWSSAPSMAAAAAIELRPVTALLNLRELHQHIPVWQQSGAAEGTDAASAGAQPAVGQARPPWTPTRELVKRKTLVKRMGHLLQVLEKEMEQEAVAAHPRPDFGPGDLLELKLSVPENKRRTTVFKGICIARRNRGWRTSFTLRNFVGNSGGIERTFPLHSPHLLEVKVLQTPNRKNYRRAKLYFLRDRQPKEYRVA